MTEAKHYTLEMTEGELLFLYDSLMRGKKVVLGRVSIPYQALLYKIETIIKAEGLRK